MFLGNRTSDNNSISNAGSSQSLDVLEPNTHSEINHEDSHLDDVNTRNEMNKTAGSPAFFAPEMCDLQDLSASGNIITMIYSRFFRFSNECFSNGKSCRYLGDWRDFILFNFW